MHISLRLAAILVAAGGLQAMAASDSGVPQTNTSVIDADGTAHVSRVVPVPTTISAEAQKSLGRQVSGNAAPETLEQRRTKTDAWQTRAGAESRAVYPVEVRDETIAGVPTRIVTPQTIPADKADRVLINIHGGGFNSDSGSLTESVPIANLTQTKVVAVLYRLAPEHPYPAALDDILAVYKELLRTYKPRKIGIYGTSAGAILTGEFAVRLRQMGLALPGCLGIFSGSGDLSQRADSQAIYALGGLSGPLSLPADNSNLRAYVGSTDAKDPVISPVFADLRGFPPALFVTSTRDLLLSGTTILHRAFLRAGVDAHLAVFEALPHAFWNDVHLPESKEAYGVMAGFFESNLSDPHDK